MKNIKGIRPSVQNVDAGAPSLKLREPKLDKCIPKFLIEEDVIT
jgi:hypothetical protein